MTGKLLRGLGATAMLLFAAIPAHAASPPGVPRISWAVGGNAQATIAFLPPLSDGGSPITGYTATCDPGAFSAT
ncbi:MAG: hypothetical protein ACXWHB_15770, partial [Usitatibacter sp.]